MILFYSISVVLTSCCIDACCWDCCCWACCCCCLLDLVIRFGFFVPPDAPPFGSPFAFFLLRTFFVFGNLWSFLYFIRRFWNQIFIWRSDNTRVWAISMRRRRVRYRLKWNSFSNSRIWWRVYAVRCLFGSMPGWYCPFAIKKFRRKKNNFIRVYQLTSLQQINQNQSNFFLVIFSSFRQIKLSAICFDSLSSTRKIPTCQSTCLIEKLFFFEAINKKFTVNNTSFNKISPH